MRPLSIPFGGMDILTYLFWPFFMLVIEWLHRNKSFGLDSSYKSHIVNFAIYITLIAVIFIFGGKAEQFIYFQF